MKGTDPLTVSVLVPAYKAASFIRIAFESIACQTYANWFLHVHEDGIFDETESIIQEFSRCYPGRVKRTFTENNCGVSSARNSLLNAAEGDYIAFLDSDDKWMPNHLESCVSQVTAHNADLVISGTTTTDGAFTPITAPFIPMPLGPRDLPAALLNHNYLLLGCCFIARPLISTLRFKTDLTIGEDLEFCVRLCERDPSIAYTGVPTMLYRKAESTLTSDVTRFNEEFSRAFEALLDSNIVSRHSLLTGIRLMLNHVIRMLWRKDNRRAMVSYKRLLRYDPFCVEASLRMLAGHIISLLSAQKKSTTCSK